VLERIVGGRTDLVFDFLAAGHAPTATDAAGVPLIRWCAFYGDVSAIRFLIGQGAPLESLGENLDLNGAAFHGHWQLCQFLLERGADVHHALPDTGETALHAALCKANRPAVDLVVEVLLAHGADPSRAARAGVETDAFMRDARTRGETPLHRAAAFGSEHVIRRLLDAGARRDARDANGEAPLAWASWHLRPDAVLRLLCYDRFSIHPERGSTYDHGAGWDVMDRSLLGTPRP
jgi:uncharacterized protein